MTTADHSVDSNADSTAANTTAVLHETATLGSNEFAQPGQVPPVFVQPAAVQPLPQTQSQPQPGTTEQTATFSITSFVLGIVSVVAGWTLVAPTVGLILGIISLRRKAPERTIALWGVWLNGAMLAISVLIAFGFMAIMAVGLFGGAYSSYWG